CATLRSYLKSVPERVRDRRRINNYPSFKRKLRKPTTLSNLSDLFFQRYLTTKIFNIMSKRKQRQVVKDQKEVKKIFRVVAISTAILLILLFIMYQVTS
ncbi:MAG: hypothetical protein ACI85O_003467, partial [Saprospiraceae bacterium]